MNFLVLPPEINSARMYLGAGAGPMLAASTVHRGLVAANRNQLVSLVFSDLFGQNAPGIAAAEAHYEQMWAEDVAAMVGYHGGAAAVAAQLALMQQALESLPLLPFNLGLGNTGIGNLFNNSGLMSSGIVQTGNFNFGAFNRGQLESGFNQGVN